MKKIVLVGGIANWLFVIKRYLKDRGFDASIILYETEQEHFLPQHDTFGDFQDDIIASKLSYLPTSFFKIEREYIRAIFDPYDIIIGGGLTPAYLHRIGRKVDVFIPYGSDIYYKPFVPLDIKLGFRKNLRNQYLNYHQKRGISSARLILMDYTNPEYEGLFSALKISDTRVYCSPPFIYVPEFNRRNIPNLIQHSLYYEWFLRIRRENEFVILHHSRHIWRDDESVGVSRTAHTKGNQKLIKAFAEFLKETKLRSHLILFEYGNSVDKSKQLIRDLGVEAYVTWMPLMSRKEILVGLTLVDLGVGELDSSYFSYGVIYEVISMGVPAIHYRKDELYKRFYPELYPMFSANSIAEVLEAFRLYERDPEHFKQVGKLAHDWFLRNAIERPMDLIEELLVTAGEIN